MRVERLFQGFPEGSAWVDPRALGKGLMLGCEALAVGWQSVRSESFLHEHRTGPHGRACTAHVNTNFLRCERVAARSSALAHVPVCGRLGGGGRGACGEVGGGGAGCGRGGWRAWGEDPGLALREGEWVPAPRYKRSGDRGNLELADRQADEQFLETKDDLVVDAAKALNRCLELLFPLAGPDSFATSEFLAVRVGPYLDDEGRMGPVLYYVPRYSEAELATLLAAS